MFDDVELVDDLGCIAEMLENSGSEIQGHVSGHRDDLIFLTAVALEPIAEGIHACGVLRQSIKMERFFSQNGTFKAEVGTIV